MPLIAFLVLGYFAGLLAGFGAVGTFAGTIAAIVMVAAVVGGAPRVAGAGAMILAGCVTGSSASDARRLCVARAATSQAVVVSLRDDVAPGGCSRGELGCGGEASVFVARGRAAAGASAGATGDISATSDTTAVLIRAATVTVVNAPPWTARFRSAAGRAVDRDFKGDAPLVRALVLADMRGMSPEIRDRWAAAGMVHMLSVSGLHVGIIAVVVELLLGVMRVSRKSAPIIAIIIIAAYVLIIGAPAPAVRSAVMLGVRAMSQLMQRSVSPWAILAIGAAHPFVDPWIVLDLGYQLSVIGVAALIAAAALVKRLPIPERPRWSRGVVAATTCTIVASIASLPLVAYTMGRVSLIAPVSNLIAGPVVAAVQPMLFLGVLLAPVPAAAGFVADAAHPILAAMNGIATISAMVPGASVAVWPSTGSAVLVGIIAIGVLMACVDRHSLRPLVVAGIASVFLVWMPPPRGAAMTELHMIDVGQGDAIALRTKAGRWVLFDAGRIWEGGDAGRRTIVPYIAHRGGRLEAFVLSHPHADHVGGAASVIDALTPGRYVDGGFVTSSEA
ncbi:MAG: ComEC/Rec2 family competence protein, partial [Gemmatimonadaceae bacterium]